MRKRYGLGDFFYLDLWPLAPPQLVVVHPDLANQMAQKINLPKESAVMQKWTGPILGNNSMVTANGHPWQVARKSFTPSFQPRKVLQHVPGIVDDVQEFCDVLKDRVQSQEIFRMEDTAARMIFNISSKAILGIKCNAQRDDDEFLDLFRKLACMAPQDFWSRYLWDISPSRTYRKWKHGRALNHYVGRIVDERMTNGPSVTGDEENYYAIDDAIAANRGVKRVSNNYTEDETRDMLISQVKTLIFAGHDTSASTLCVSLSHQPDQSWSSYLSSVEL